jgi:hypothetical protein
MDSDDGLQALSPLCDTSDGSPGGNFAPGAGAGNVQSLAVNRPLSRQSSVGSVLTPEENAQLLHGVLSLEDVRLANGGAGAKASIGAGAGPAVAPPALPPRTPSVLPRSGTAPKLDAAPAAAVSVAVADWSAPADVTAARLARAQQLTWRLAAALGALLVLSIVGAGVAAGWIVSHGGGGA